MLLKLLNRAALLAAISITTTLSIDAQADIEAGFINETYTARHLWQSVNQGLENKSFSCPEVLPAKITFESGSIYKDTPCRCEVDPEKKAQYDAEKQYIASYSVQLTKLADDYVATPTERDEIAMCAMEHIEAWATNGAMLGEHAESIGYHKTADILGVISSSYIKIAGNKNVEKVTPDSEVGIWMREAADKIINFYLYDAGSTTANNNHRYWDGLAVGRAASVISDQQLFSWAMEGLTIGLDQIQLDGTLPLELKRGSKAHAYHLFATMPLMALAEMAIENMEYMPEQYNPYLYNDGALDKLANMLIQTELNGINELFETHQPMTCSYATFAEIYKRRAPVTVKSDAIDILTTKREQCGGKLYNTYMGGNISMMFGKPTL